MQVFLIELIVNVTASEEAKTDFLSFCDSWYRNDSAYLVFKRKIEAFQRDYRAEDAIEWYTNPDTFIFRIISKTCATFDIGVLFKIRFILHDVYVQLKELYTKQLENLLQGDIIVHRGMMMPTSELNCLQNKGELFITRNFLSTTMNKEIAKTFAGDGATEENKKSVVISMKIVHSEMQDKPIAFIGDHRAHGSEEEVMLSAGMVFRVDSYEEVPAGSRRPLVINMVRGKDEKQIEKKLEKFHLLAQTGASCTALGMVIFLASTQNGQHASSYATLMPRALESSNSQIAEQLSGLSNNINVHSTTVSLLRFTYKYDILLRTLTIK
jgi:hypothetical protein